MSINTIQNAIQDNWSDVKAQIKSKWSKFSDKELDGFKDNLDKISMQIQKTYGTAKDQAEKEFNDFKKSIKPNPSVAAQADAMQSEGGGSMNKAL